MCLFDSKGLTTYKKEEVQIEGKIFTRDERDKKNRFYPLSLYRNVGEKIPPSRTIAALANIPAIPARFISQVCEWGDLPLVIPDKPIPATLLAKSYTEPSLSQVERMHAKCGDVGIKFLKRIMPSLKVPDKYRCEFCIEGKIHKFGHKACPPGTRTEYAPGVCIHSDHSGPYAQSRKRDIFSYLARQGRNFRRGKTCFLCVVFFVIFGVFCAYTK